MITYKVIEYQKKRSLVAINEAYPGRLYWFGGMSYMPIGEDVTILHTFDPTDDPDVEDNIELTFWREWNPPVAGELDVNGWLAPDGTFYPCEYGEHDSLGKQIVAAKYNRLHDYRYLDTHNWLRVQDGSVVFVGYDVPSCTQQQLNILYDISQLPGVSKYGKRQAAWYIEHAPVV